MPDRDDEVTAAKEANTKLRARLAQLTLSGAETSAAEAPCTKCEDMDAKMDAARAEFRADFVKLQEEFKKVQMELDDANQDVRDHEATEDERVAALKKHNEELQKKLSAVEGGNTEKANLNTDADKHWPGRRASANNCVSVNSVTVVNPNSVSSELSISSAAGTSQCCAVQ